jgi:hypothetical protein
MRWVFAALAATAVALGAGVPEAAASGECGLPVAGDVCPPPTQPVSALGFRSTWAFTYVTSDATACDAALPVAAAPPGDWLAALSGCVVDYRSGVVPGAVVVVAPTRGRGTALWAVADDFGDFAFTDIDVRRPYDVFVWAPGHRSCFGYGEILGGGRSWVQTIFLDSVDRADDLAPMHPCGSSCGPPLSGVPLDGQVPPRQ